MIAVRAYIKKAKETMSIRSSWQELAPVCRRNFIRTKRGCCVTTTNFKFMIVSNTKSGAIFAIHETKGILKYSSDSDTWQKYHTINQLPHEMFDDPIQPAAMDADTDTIYIVDEVGSMASIDIKDNRAEFQSWLTCSTSWNIHLNIDMNAHQIGSGAQGIIINNEFHIIGGSDNGNHLKWNQDTNKFEIATDNICEELKRGQYHGLVKLSKNKILSMGGYDGIFVTDKMLEYEVSNRKWRTLGLRMPVKRMGFGATSTLNGKYVLIFGGENNDSGFSDILVYDIENQVIGKSLIKTPWSRNPFFNCQGFWKAVTIVDGLINELVFGFLRQKCHKLFPPMDLVALISEFYRIEYIHLIESENGRHWRIPAYDLIPFAS